MAKEESRGVRMMKRAEEYSVFRRNGRGDIDQVNYEVAKGRRMSIRRLRWSRW